MHFVQICPTKVHLVGTDAEIELMTKYLTYKDREVEQQIKMLKKMKNRWGEDYVAGRIAVLEPELNKTMVMSDKEGWFIYAGLLQRATECPTLKVEGIENQVQYPGFNLRPWDKQPPYDPLPYQTAARNALVANPHSHIEMATGVGKSFLAHLLTKSCGLPTIVSTPSAGIARQLYREAVTYFGKRKVGLFGDGKREIGKDILICVGKSLSTIKDPDEKKEFLKYQVLISDESHTLPASEFQYFCLDLLAHVPYRWFLSATQERNDGRDLLLEGIIGKRAFTYTIQRAIEEGYLAKLSFLVFDVMSKSTHRSDRVVEMNQEHIYKNQDIAFMIGLLTKQAVEAGMPTLILIDEYAQEQMLNAYLRVPYAFGSGKSDVEKICREFNEGKHMVVVGTSAVSTGMNFKPNRLTINWQANKAGTKVKQGAIGRSTRLDERTGKTDCKIVDFRIKNVPILKRHADIRMEYYNEISPVQVVNLEEALS